MMNDELFKPVLILDFSFLNELILESVKNEQSNISVVAII